MRRKLLFLLTIFLSLFQITQAEEMKAYFSSPNANTIIYQNGFDTDDDIADWTIASSSSNTWQLSNEYGYGVPDYSELNPLSKKSLFVHYSYDDNQNEHITSPYFDIAPNTMLNFQTAFHGVWILYANFVLYAQEEGADSKEVLFDAFAYAQDNGYDNMQWHNIMLDLNQWANKNVRFIFSYVGQEGDDVYIDDFKLLIKASDDDAQVSINLDEMVSFENLSSGPWTSCSWEFEGATPSTSVEENPVVTYSQVGSFDVSLTVSDGVTEHTFKRADFVKVQGTAPMAQINYPEEGYCSPYIGTFIPANVPVQFKDASKGKPNKWMWSFTGTDSEHSADQNPTVTFTSPGLHSVGLSVENDFGLDQTQLNHGIQVGSKNNIWNITPDENSDIDVIALGWYGYYGGTNFLGMEAFAEYFKKPLAPALVESVNLYFGLDQGAQDGVITIQMTTVGADGMPDQILAEKSFTVADIKNPETYEATVVTFDEPVAIDAPFFIVMRDCPAGDTDNIALYAYRRKAGELNSAFHQLTDEEDPSILTWYESTEDPLSLCMAPMLSYDITTDVDAVQGNKDAALAAVDAEHILINPAFQMGTIYVYDLQGKAVATFVNAKQILKATLGNGLFVIMHEPSKTSQKIAL